jgi:catechol 2,3-dioxygenase-like lactoylglutathione lyase family enzyme
MTVHYAKVIPEFDVADLDRSFTFYVHVLGFSVAYTRPEERFAFLELEGAQLMLQEIGTARRFQTAPLERPYGRGVSLQILVADADAMLAKLAAAGHTPVVPIEEKWYRAGSNWMGQRQFVVADPDGYLLRFARSIGSKG